MKRVFLLRAYGDFIVALQSLVSSPIKNEFEIVASLHHYPLYESLKDSISLADLNIRFEDWKIQPSQFRLFTNRHILHSGTLNEMQAFNNSLKKKLGISKEDFLESTSRKLFLEVFTGQSFGAIASKNEMVYDAFHRFFKSQKNLIAEPITTARKILILPSARIQRRDIPSYIISTIQQKQLAEGDSVTVAYFKNTPRVDATIYTSFHELVALISAADFVYGADSLPIHLCYLLQKPHFVWYPRNGSQLFFTPYIMGNQFFNTF
jgi:hypothetical protein